MDDVEEIANALGIDCTTGVAMLQPLSMDYLEGNVTALGIDDTDFCESIVVPERKVWPVAP
jgi:hypothetical protein